MARATTQADLSGSDRSWEDHDSFELAALQGHGWWNNTLGHLTVEVSTEKGIWNVLSGTTSTPIGRIYERVDTPGLDTVYLELHPEQACARRLLLDRNASSRFRLSWRNEESGGGKDPGSDASIEVWDGRLLRAAREGSAWIVKNFGESLDPCFEEAIEMMKSYPTTSWECTIGLCVSTKNRFWQLRHALPLNLVHAWPHRSWVRFHVVECGGQDDALRFILDQCRAAIECGLLNVYTTDDRMPFWHASVGKNTAHMVSVEDILVNLDCDNLIGPNFLRDIQLLFSKGCTAAQFEDGDGTCGRIVCYRKDFHAIRGYDEDCYPMGAQDFDLVERLKMLKNSKFKRCRSQDSNAIPNTKVQAIDHVDPAFGSTKWGTMNSVNSDVFRERRANGQVVRNLHLEQLGVPARRLS